jgi:hypothetical protein
MEFFRLAADGGGCGLRPDHEGGGPGGGGPDKLAAVEAHGENLRCGGQRPRGSGAVGRCRWYDPIGPNVTAGGGEG